MTRYEKFKAQGLCCRCGATPLEGKTRCERCHKAQLEYSKKAKAKAVKNGLCPTCGKAPKTTDSVLCESCLLRNRLKKIKLTTKTGMMFVAEAY